MKRLTNNNLDFMEAAVKFYDETGVDEVDFDALPALLAELRELRRLTTPEPISEKHRDGNWWLVWYWPVNEWVKMQWRYDHLVWQTVSGSWAANTPTHALPLPGRPEPPAARGEE
jgi:hypothetical protein